MALIKNRNKKLAREAVENAKGMLSEEDFADMITMLNKLEPGFIK